MLLTDWANGHGQNLFISPDEANGLIGALAEARNKYLTGRAGRGIAVLDTTEIDVYIEPPKDK